MLTPLAPEIWCAEHDTYAGGVCFPGRMTVIRLPDGTLWLHSAVPIDDSLAADLDALGPVRHVVAPNAFHHRYAAAAKARYPDATLHATPALRAKIANLPIDRTLDAGLANSWEGVLEMCEIGGAPRLHEFVFMHVPTRTLIVTDLLFNMRSYTGLLSKIAFWMAGTYKRLAVSRLWKASTKDDLAFSRSLKQVLELDFDRLIPAHGEVIDAGAHAAVDAVLGPTSRR